MWTSLNHHTFVAITIHFEQQGQPVCFLLDLIKVTCSHTGVNLAAAFTKVLKDFGIESKVSIVLSKCIRILTFEVCRLRQ